MRVSRFSQFRRDKHEHATEHKPRTGTLAPSFLFLQLQRSNRARAPQWVNKILRNPFHLVLVAISLSEPALT